MKRRVSAISDQAIREQRTVTFAPGTVLTLVGDWASSRGVHVLCIAVPNDTEVELT